LKITIKFEMKNCNLLYYVVILFVQSLSSQGFTPSQRTSSSYYALSEFVNDKMKQSSLISMKSKFKNSRSIMSFSLEAHTGPVHERSFLNSLRSLLFVLRRRWFVLRRIIRANTEKYTIYVLQCENGKYYVGSTANKKQRFKEHFQSARSGSKWTRIHKPIKVLKEYKRVSKDHYLGLEAKITANLMWKYGVNNVRGAFFSHPRIYTQDDVDALRGFLGHFNSLSFSETFDVLLRTLPDGIEDKSTTMSKSARLPHRSIRSFNKVPRASDRCHKCGGRGHWARDCPRGKATANLGRKGKRILNKDANDNQRSSVESRMVKKSNKLSDQAFSTVSRDLAESAVRIEIERRVMKGPWDDGFDPNRTTFQ
jgi:predicted GIY-YIG superfamily endonuclease